eukprot:363369-Chlamydomonas_euryale.AAC.2
MAGPCPHEITNSPATTPICRPTMCARACGPPRRGQRCSAWARRSPQRSRRYLTPPTPLAVGWVLRGTRRDEGKLTPPAASMSATSAHRHSSPSAIDTTFGDPPDRFCPTALYLRRFPLFTARAATLRRWGPAGACGAAAAAATCLRSAPALVGAAGGPCRRLLVIVDGASGAGAGGMAAAAWQPRAGAQGAVPQRPSAGPPTRGSMLGDAYHADGRRFRQHAKLGG